MTSKSKLNLYCQKKHTAVPCCSTERISEGFVSTVTVAETSHKSQKAHSTKRAAEDDAASVAIQLIVQSHPEVANIDQLIEANSKKRTSHQQLNLPATHAFPPLGNTSGPVRPSGQLPPPGMTVGLVPNHGQPHFSGLSPAPQMPLVHMQPPAPATLLNPPIPPLQIPTPQYPSYWDEDVRHKGRPASAIPANPHRNHGNISSSPTEQNILSVSSPQTASSPQNSAFSAPMHPRTPPQRGVSKPQEALEALCRQHGLSPPNYHIAQNARGYYTAKVFLGDSELSTMREYDDFDTAKESATALAVIELGLQTLTLSNAGDTLQAPLQQQVQSPQQQIIKPPALTSTLDHPQQTPLAATSIHTTGSAPLHPPSFFHTPSLLTGHHPQQTPSHAPDRPPPCLSPPSCSSAENPELTLVSLPQPPASLAVPVQSKGGVSQEANMALPPGDYKQMLNIYCQKKHIPLPSYSCEFPEDSVGYIASVAVAGMTFSSTPQGSKRLAEAIAAAEAVKSLGIAQGDGEQHQPSGVGTGGGSVPPAHQPAVPLSFSAAGGAISFKNLLQEYTQKSKLSLPHYETERTEEGFKSTVSIYKSSEETVTFTSAGYSVKKAAEQEAAKIACTELNLLAP